MIICGEAFKKTNGESKEKTKRTKIKDVGLSLDLTEKTQKTKGKQRKNERANDKNRVKTNIK